MINKPISPYLKKFKKVRVLATGVEYYTTEDWPTKDVDGVTFIAVTKSDPLETPPISILFLRKDSVEYT